MTESEHEKKLRNFYTRIRSMENQIHIIRNSMSAQEEVIKEMGHMITFLKSKQDDLEGVQYMEGDGY